MALVQTSGKKQSDAISGTVNYTFPGNVTAGNTVIIALSHFSSTASEISGITVSGTAAVKDISKTDGTGNFAQVWRASNCAGGSATIAVTFVGSGNFINFSAEEWDNISSSPLDQTGTGGATSSAAPSVTSAGATTQADEVVYAVFTDYVGTSWTSSTPPSGYTETYEETNGTAHEAGSAAYRVIASTGSQTATFATGSSMSWISAMATYKLTGGGGGATPTISSTSSSTPAYTSSLTITGTNFEAAQGIGTVTIGGVLQTVTAWSDTSITITVGRGTNKYGVSVNVVVTNNSALSSSGYALTSLQPQSGWSYVDIATPNTTTSNRITSVPDLASGDQVSYTTLGGQVVLANDGTFSVAPEVRSFDFEVWSSPDGWGGSATQYVRVDLVDIRLRRIRQRSAAARWMWAGYTNEKLTQRGWFSRDIVLPISAASGTHTTTGALSAQAATISGAAQHQHAATGALSAQAATVAGSAAHLTLHTTTGALSAQSATIAGSAAHQHATTGALQAQSATIAGSATHTAAGASHSTSGALTADAATVSGSATHLTLHTTTGALGAQSATISGAAVHPHTTSGALQAQSATLAGAAAHATLHTTSGALSAQAATLLGTAAHEHATTGVLAAQSATISGAAARATAGIHDATGALQAQSATIDGSSTGPATSGGGYDDGPKKRHRWLVQVGKKVYEVDNAQEAMSLMDKLDAEEAPKLEKAIQAQKPVKKPRARIVSAPGPVAKAKQRTDDAALVTQMLLRRIAEYNALIDAVVRLAEEQDDEEALLMLL